VTIVGGVRVACGSHYASTFFPALDAEQIETTLHCARGELAEKGVKGAPASDLSTGPGFVEGWELFASSKR